MHCHEAHPEYKRKFIWRDRNRVPPLERVFRQRNDSTGTRPLFAAQLRPFFQSPHEGLRRHPKKSRRTPDASIGFIQSLSDEPVFLRLHQRQPRPLQGKPRGVVR